MNIKQATVIITSLFDKLNNTTPESLYPWKIQARSITENIFGKESHEYRSIGQFHRDNTYSSDNEIYQDKIKEINSLKSLRDIFLITLNAKGVYKQPKKNWFSNISEGWMIFILTSLAGIGVLIYNIGYWVGERSDKQDIVKTENSKEPIRTKDSSKNNPAINGKNVNTGTNNGMIGDINTPVQPHPSQKDVRDIEKQVPNKNAAIRFIYASNSKFSHIFSQELITILKQKGYTRLAPGMSLDPEGRKPYGITQGDQFGDGHYEFNVNVEK